MYFVTMWNSRSDLQMFEKTIYFIVYYNRQKISFSYLYQLPSLNIVIQLLFIDWFLLLPTNNVLMHIVLGFGWFLYISSFLFNNCKKNYNYLTTYHQTKIKLNYFCCTNGMLCQSHWIERKVLFTYPYHHVYPIFCPCWSLYSPWFCILVSICDLQRSKNIIVCWFNAYISVTINIVMQYLVTISYKLDIHLVHTF